MVVVVKKGTDEQQLSHLIDWLKSMDIDVHFSAGKYETVLGLIGDTTQVDIEYIEAQSIVESGKARIYLTFCFTAFFLYKPTVKIICAFTAAQLQ